ncbi:GNAT family N-acetyltransferase [Ciceribacter sp. RN22]|uniref:GNAT family N-acetyltransferase n=1 Tax=Ciceribacter sp. RN22 TaxID=2954932 RepID=UPI0020936988|nr:GNAT family N-acetyltransferase [Ciceribacter sp. RN22]MCO6178732.1 GNAT family N-acetyltransferase [Ciceribacter sp. RN22]
MSLQDPSSSAPSNWPDGLQIRARTATDVAGLADLHNMPGYRSGTLRLPYQSADDVRRAIEAQGSSVTALVAVMDGRIVGDLGLHGFQGRRAHAGMIGMGVHDDYIRRGIGRALLSEIVRIADEWLNIRRLELTVFIDNAGAIALYESFGFRVEGTLRDYAYRAGRYMDAHTMARLRADQAERSA